MIYDLYILYIYTYYYTIVVMTSVPHSRGRVLMGRAHRLLDNLTILETRQQQLETRQQQYLGKREEVAPNDTQRS